MIRIVAFIFFLSTLSFGSFAQKVKYKDLILLLKAKQYDKAEVFLKRYLKETSDNPNAFLFMGFTFQDKAEANDVLKQTPALLSNCDSAILFYDKAYNTISEKELKHNDEYYEMYSRRDLRTGKFGIKLSDVKLDLETRVKELKEKKENVKELKKYYVLAEQQYARVFSAYKSIESKYSSEHTLYLRADEVMVTKLKQIELSFDSVVSSFERYKSISKRLGKTNYNQQLNLQEIADMKKEGLSGTDFTRDDLKIWDYKRWSKSAVETIEKVIYPMRDRLISYDIALNKLQDKIKKDSVSVVGDIAQLEDKLLYSQLLKYDAVPLPISVFDLKKAEMSYQSVLISHKPLRDSINIEVKLASLKDELKDINLLDSLSSKLMSKDLNKEMDNYSQFVTKAYGTKSVLLSLIKTTEDYAHREKIKKQMEWERTLKATRWIVNGMDSIPLSFDQSTALNFKPLVVEKKYTVGLHYKDSLATGYLYNITPSHVPNVKVAFKVDQSNFKKSNLPAIKCLSTTDASGQVFYSVIYSENKVDNSYPITVTKIYSSDGLAWSNNMKLEMLPMGVSYSAENGMLSIKTDNKTLMIDKSGKEIK
jgi:hypothetical protein